MGEEQEWRQRRRRVRRVHGLQHPLHPQQVLSWLVMIAFIAFTFGAIVPALHSSLALPVAISSGILFFSHIVTHVIALFLDPADPQLRALKKKQQLPEFNRNIHSHVIENGRCHLCNITITSSRTKHCSACNKCVDVFDHHCKWLNHCIGKRNYKVFIACVVTAILSCMMVMGTCVAEIVLYYFDREHLSPWEKGRQGTRVPSKQKEKEYSEEEDPIITCQVGSPYCHFSVFGARVYDGAFIGILSTLFSIALVAEVLLLHLGAFHAYINYLGLTTYEYIRGNNFRDSSSAQSFSTYGRDEKLGSEGAVCGWTVMQRSSQNQITPSSTTDTTLLPTPSYDSSIGSRSPRPSSANSSPLTLNDSPFSFPSRHISPHNQSPSLRLSRDSPKEGDYPSKHEIPSPQNVPKTSTSSTVPTLPQISKPNTTVMRSRIGLRSVIRSNTVPPTVKNSTLDNEVEVRIISIPRPRPSRRRIRSSVAPHLSPIKECDHATSSPPSVRGTHCNDSDCMDSQNNSPSRPVQFKASSQHSTSITASPPSTKKAFLPNSIGNIPSSPSSSNYQLPSKSTVSIGKSSPLRSPSHSQIYPRPHPSLSKNVDLYGNPHTKIFVVNEHNYNSPAKIKGPTLVKSATSPIISPRSPALQKSPSRAQSPAQSSPVLMANINGKSVAITIINGHIENIRRSPDHQNGRISNNVSRSSVANKDKDVSSGSNKKVTFETQENDRNCSDFENKRKSVKSNKPTQNGSAHVELHM